MTPKQEVEKWYADLSSEWVGLTDEEIADLAPFIGMTQVDIPTLIAFIRSVEEKLKERNT